MHDALIFFIAIFAGYSMATVAGLAGAWLACKCLAGKEGTPFAPEPKGDVFTIEDPDETALFPDENDEGKATEEHILERTNKFLQAFGGKG